MCPIQVFLSHTLKESQPVVMAHHYHNFNYHTSHPAEHILTQARHNLDFLRCQGETPTLTYGSVFASIVSLFRKSYLCPHDLVKVVRMSCEVAYLKFKATPRVLSIIRLSVADDAAQCLARQGVKVSGPWETAVNAIIILASSCDPDNLRQGYFHSHIVRRWVLDVFSDSNMCPNVSIRLRMLMVIQFWWYDQTIMQNEYIGQRIMSGLIQLVDHLDVTRHYTPGAAMSDLAQPLYRILYGLRKAGHLKDTFNKAVVQVETLTVGPEARFVARLAELVSGGVMITKVMFQRGTLSAYNTVCMVEMSMVQLRDLVFSSHYVGAYCLRGMSRVASMALIQVALSILELTPTLKRKYEGRCDALNQTILSILEGVFNCPRCHTLSHILKTDHIRDLQTIMEQASTPLDLTTDSPKDPDDCPER